MLVLANGASGIQPNQKESKKVEEALTQVMEDLARQIVRDGEGARKLVTIDVTGAANEEAATRIARSIANSPLVKTAIAGSDPNWGRIISAAGNAGVPLDPSKVDIDLQGVPVCRGGLAAEFSESELKKKLDEPECPFDSRSTAGPRAARVSGRAISPRSTLRLMRAIARSIALASLVAALACADAHDDVMEVVTSMAGALSDTGERRARTPRTFPGSCQLSAKICRTTTRSKRT